MSDTTALTLRLNRHLHSRLRAQADREGVSINRLAQKAIEARVDNSEPAALDQRDSMEALAQALLSVQGRLGNLERLARQSGADL